MNLFTLIASGADQAEQAQPNGVVSILSMLIPLALMVLIFYFLIIRPEKKRNKETQAMLDSIQGAD